jgi:hypothetical protein
MTTARLTVSIRACTQPSVPCQSRIIRQFSNSLVISTGISLRVSTHSIG